LGSGCLSLVVMPREDVAALIRAAFADTPYPGAEFGDISATMWDEGIVEYFRGKSWRGHKVLDLRHHGAALSFFTDKAFRYWLPAFMLAELETPIEADVIGENIASSLTRRGYEARLGEFAQDELEAIAAFCDECDFQGAARAVRAQIQKGITSGCREPGDDASVDN